MRILVTGVTGYVGRLLVKSLISTGHDVTCMVRNSSRRTSPLAAQGRVIQADPLKPETLPPALEGIEVAYYLIHSMSGQEEGFAERDRRAAFNFATEAKRAGVKRIIYLGGLATAGSAVSAHLKSRQETGAVLRRFGPPVIEFRAAVIVGNGSTSFEIIRCLAERLPIMICPRWVVTRTQPIAIDDVLAYLVAALDLSESIAEPIEIGGSVESYRSMMLTYARQRGLKRWLICVPVLTPRLSSYWLDLVTPVPAAVSRPLIEGLRSESICTSTLAATLFPSIRPITYETAVAKALESSPPSLLLALAGRNDHQTIRAEGVICDIRQTVIDAAPHHVYGLLESMGGKNGWFYGDWLWRVRGWLDQLVGGFGMTRGRARTVGMQPGDSVDFWRVERAQAPSTLLLRAEMKLPGAAWLQFDLAQQDDGRTLLRCCAWFQPRGLAGEAYWYALYPIHLAVFRGMVGRIRQRAQELGPAGNAIHPR